jgi:hypothetical protein
MHEGFKEQSPSPEEKIPTQEAIARLNKERVIADAKTLEEGAEITPEGKIYFTEEQLEAARKEMLYEKDRHFRASVELQGVARDTLNFLNGEFFHESFWKTADIKTAKVEIDKLADRVHTFETEYQLKTEIPDRIKELQETLETFDKWYHQIQLIKDRKVLDRMRQQRIRFIHYITGLSQGLNILIKTRNEVAQD